MEVKAKVDNSVMDDFERDFDKLLADEGLKLAKEQIKNIKARLVKGKGLDDATMQDYTEEYKKVRRKFNRQTQVRDLDLTGTMVKDIAILREKQRDETVITTIGFKTSRSNRIAEFHQRRKKFFGVSKQDDQDLEKMLQRDVNSIEVKS